MSFPFHPELAYIGPGAGFAFLGSFLSILGGVLLGAAQFPALARSRPVGRGYRPAGIQAAPKSGS